MMKAIKSEVRGADWFYGLGKEAAQSSLDAHGRKVNPEDAWEFAVENLIDEDDDQAYAECRSMANAPIDFIAGYFEI